ncbi:hypothetical protein Poli38472_008259 [Pythium oligandrum]|uniref:Uncharacterized protein n=1 Tax=Pythium oligandrum TaxID=41045 RepID=A0A8K1CLD4_PYTOL|nr:hypothetical protein Poli38472_008259 [Pythium oligandrum]|eukprot:TMW65617.1 hypothetical protein Poli38472_008259 [Pythium oligandrum]
MSDEELLQRIQELTTKTQEQQHSVPVKSVEAPTQLNATERAKLVSINESFRRDYTLRRALMLERCDVTLESFTWSKAGKEHQTTMEQELQALRSTLAIEPRVLDLDNVFPEKQDAREVIKDPVSSLRTLVIGPVPDRGGRTDELDDKTMNQAAKGTWGSQTKRESKQFDKQRKSKTRKTKQKLAIKGTQT